MRHDVSPEEVIDLGLRRLRESLYHCMPGIVMAYHAVDQTVDVQPAVNDVRFDFETGERVSEPWPVIPHVKILWPKFGGMAVYGQMAQNDKVTLVASDLDPGAYQASGNQSDPTDTRRHGGAYWNALPCDITDPGSLTDIGPNVLGIGKIGSMSDHVALTTKTDSNLETLRSNIATALGSAPVATLAQVAAVLNALIVLFSTGTLGTAQGSVGSATVKVSP